MGERHVVTEWQSLHQDYLQFALDSVRAVPTTRGPVTVRGPLNRVEVNRHVLEAVRYSYDALEASVSFVFRVIEAKERGLSFNDTWLKRYVERKRRALSLGDKLGLISIAWGEREFWGSNEQRVLFDDLKKLRDGLTHPRPFGEERLQEVLERQESDPSSTVAGVVEAGNAGLMAPRVGEARVCGANRVTRVPLSCRANSASMVMVRGGLCSYDKSASEATRTCSWLRTVGWTEGAASG